MLTQRKHARDQKTKKRILQIKIIRAMTHQSLYHALPKVSARRRISHRMNDLEYGSQHVFVLACECTLFILAFGFKHILHSQFSVIWVIRFGNRLGRWSSHRLAAGATNAGAGAAQLEALTVWDRRDRQKDFAFEQVLLRKENEILNAKLYLEKKTFQRRRDGTPQMK